MIDKLKKDFKCKKILILGFGREGASSYRVLRSLFPTKHLFIADGNEALCEKNTFLKEDAHLTLLLGDHYLSELMDFDIIIKSPGVSLAQIDDPEIHLKVTSQTDLFIAQYHKQIIGVTGSKGKSTTSSLICHILKQQFDDVLLIGNIGIPAFDVLEQIKPSSLIVFELSAHQLAYIHKAPDVSVLLNIYEEHLDHFLSYENYQKAKLMIASKQDRRGVFLYHKDDDLINKHIRSLGCEQQLLGFSLKNSPIEGAWSVGEHAFNVMTANEKVHYQLREDLMLRGKHNLLNIMAATLVTQLKGMSPSLIKQGIVSFHPLEHRLEFVGKYQEIYFYNDSIATIPEACINAVRTIKNVETLILGGFDRGISYTSLLSDLSVSSVRNFLFIGSAGERMYNEMLEIGCENKILFLCEDYQEVVQLAYRHTNAGHAVLLSPAAASYDMFKNFEERGTTFKMFVSDYPKNRDK